MKITRNYYRLPALLATVSAVLLLSACGGGEGSRLDQFNNSSNRSATPLPSNSSSSSSTNSSSANSSAATNSSITNSTSSTSSSSIGGVGSGNSSKAATPTSSASSSSINLIDAQAPTIPVLSQKGLLSNSVTISWSAASDNKGVTAYRVFRDGTQIAQVGNGTLTYTDRNLVANTSYTYTVRAGDAQGNWSAVSNAMRLKTLIVSAEITLEWFIPTERENGDYLELRDIGGYEIRYKLLSADQYTSVLLKDGTIDQYDLGYLAGDYEFQIATFDTNGLYSDFIAIDPN